MAVNEIQKDHARLLENMKLLQKMFTVKKLAEYLGIGISTWNYRMKEPWKLFSYDDFRTLSKFCNVDIMQIIDGTLKIQ